MLDQDYTFLVVSCLMKRKNLHGFTVLKILAQMCAAMISPVQIFLLLHIHRHKGKSYPIVVEVDGLIYVLTGFRLVDDIPDPSFEVFDPSTNKWTSLETPPFLNAFSIGNIFPSLMQLLIKRYMFQIPLCSFAFDTRSGKWETCASTPLAFAGRAVLYGGICCLDF
ncbi:hypothetical protein ACH5RR_022129 [Cinchona calisaya]|uniref:Uncharacterized protein n=1 Tax=Cinchona calisaya TaxID=153742 RepID=A0ABD2ZA56_9GENT